MFKNTKAFSSFSVDDINKAKEFYTDILGLKVSQEEYGSLSLHIEGNNPIMVYPKGNDHVPATYTVLNFPVENIEQAVKELKQKGVQFNQYDSGDLKTDENGISRWSGRGPSMAWFNDPAGNIFSVMEV